MYTIFIYYIYIYIYIYINTCFSQVPLIRASGTPSPSRGDHSPLIPSLSSPHTALQGYLAHKEHLTPRTLQ